MKKTLNYQQFIPALTHEEIFAHLGRGSREIIESDPKLRKHLPAFNMRKQDGPYEHSRKADDALYELAYGFVEARRGLWQRLILVGTLLATLATGALMLRGNFPLSAIVLLCGPLIMGSQLIALLRLHSREGKRERKLRDKLVGCRGKRLDLIGGHYHQQAFNLFVRFAAFSDLLTDPSVELSCSVEELRRKMATYLAHAHELHTRTDMTQGERAGLEMAIGQIVESIEGVWQELVAEHLLHAKFATIPVYAPTFGLAN